MPASAGIAPSLRLPESTATPLSPAGMFFSFFVLSSLQPCTATHICAAASAVTTKNLACLFIGARTLQAATHCCKSFRPRRFRSATCCNAREDTGYIRRETDPEDARASLASLTRKGHTLLETVDQIYGDLESRWAKILSPRRLEVLRSVLQRVLQPENQGHLPPVRRREWEPLFQDRRGKIMTSSIAKLVLAHNRNFFG